MGERCVMWEGSLEKAGEKGFGVAALGGEKNRWEI
jgi:hypothetical protein